MEKLLTFSIQDHKVGKHLQLITARSIGEATRMFETACKDPSTQFNKHPSDFTLFHTGYWCDDTGSTEPLDKNVLLCNASEYQQ